MFIKGVCKQENFVPWLVRALATFVHLRSLFSTGNMLGLGVRKFGGNYRERLENVMLAEFSDFRNPWNFYMSDDLTLNAWCRRQGLMEETIICQMSWNPLQIKVAVMLIGSVEVICIRSQGLIDSVVKFSDVRRIGIAPKRFAHFLVLTEQTCPSKM